MHEFIGIIVLNLLVLCVGSTVATICSCEVGRAVAITVGVIVAIECLIAVPIIGSVMAFCCRKR